MKMIFIYDDGIHNQYSLIRALQDAGLEHRICSADDILQGALEQAEILIMPGGADLYYCEKLNGTGNDHIRHFVDQGGHYIGICAGAYYATRRIFWAEKEGDRAICGERELGLYPGSASGPIYPFLKNNDITASWRKTVTIQWANGEEDQVHYEGGPLFTGDKDDYFTALAHYSDLPGNPPAILQGRFGQGRVTLSSPHIETCRASAEQEIYNHNNSFHKEDLREAEKLCKENTLIKIISEAQV